MTVCFYRVGGCVRDALLRQTGENIPEGDRDWVVTGATPEWMTSRGFRPVGADFPVFLHPQTHEEYALARTERKTARGYHGFLFYAAPDVTLEDDLKRRDLTVNAMAQDDAGNIIDPYGGKLDLKARVLRHVSDAFCEDPVRILRLARFAARFPSFSVAPETIVLARRMVDDGETDALVAERVYKEIFRGFGETAPCRMIEVLNQCGFWQRNFADFAVDDDLLECIGRAAKLPSHADITIALVFGRLNNVSRLRKRLTDLRFDSETLSLCELAARHLASALSAQTPQEYVALFSAGDVLRRPKRFERLMMIAKVCDPAFDDQRMSSALRGFSATDAAAVAHAQKCPADIAPALIRARTQAVSAALK